MPRAEDRGRVDHPVGQRERLRVEPQIAWISAPSTSASPTVTSTCSMCRLVERPDQVSSMTRRDHGTDGEAEDGADEELRPGTAADLLGHPPRRIRADGEEGAVSEVEHAHQAVDQRQAGADQEVHRPEPEPGDRQQDERAHRGLRHARRAARAPAPGRRAARRPGRHGRRGPSRGRRRSWRRGRRRRGSARRGGRSPARPRARAPPRPRSRAAARAPSSARRRGAPGCRSGARARSRPSAAGRRRACRPAARRASRSSGKSS